MIVGVGANLLGRLPSESIVAPHTPARDIVKARCVAAVVTKEAEKEQGETIPPRWGSLHRSTMVDTVVIRLSRGHTPGKNAYNNKQILYVMGLHHVYKII